jgi:hypothetical protein
MTTINFNNRQSILALVRLLDRKGITGAVIDFNRKQARLTRHNLKELTQ